jgi:hypothetical protein
METKTGYKLKKASILQLSTYITKYKTMQTIVLVLSLPRTEKMTILIKIETRLVENHMLEVSLLSFPFGG